MTTTLPTTTPPTENLPTVTSSTWTLAQRSSIRAFRAGRHLLILAEGDLPDPGWEVDIAPSPRMGWPPHFDLLRRERPGAWGRSVAPYRHGEVVTYPDDLPTVTVHHVDGEDEVEIEPCGDDLAEFAALVGGGTEQAGDPAAGAEAVGMSRRLDFDEAFADALTHLPPSIPARAGAVTRVNVVDVGALFGGSAGFHHLVVRIQRIGG